MAFGVFAEKEYKQRFLFEDKAPDQWSADRGATDTVYVGIQDKPRAAMVKKTVAYIAVDEDADGGIVWEKWQIRMIESGIPQCA